MNYQTKSFPKIKQNLQEVSSQMKLVTSEFGKNDNSISSLSKKQDILNKQLEQQKTKVQLLRNQYTELSETEDENSESMQKLRTEINKAQAEVNKTTNEIGKLDKKMEDAKKPTDDLGESIEDAGEKAEKSANGGFTIFKGIVANLGSQAIISAVNGLKQLGGAFVNLGKQAIQNYADYEQLVGGVETLFGTGGLNVEEYAKKVGKSVAEVQEEWTNLDTAQSDVLYNASQAYKTAGLSANEYMETVTSFSASLIQSLGGDTLKATSYADRAITDMSDNANKMGTSMEMIQNAYQGFAKQNYTMLDNLKLGYGGTKTEMERLISDASKMKDVQDELNISVKDGDMSFANIVNAISVVQKNMGIMGTTSKEASETISGSVNAMKSAWSNLVTGMADDNAQFDELINGFVDSLLTMLNNILPRIKVVIGGMAKVIGALLEEVVPELIKMIPPLLKDTLPVLMDGIKSLLDSIMEILPSVIQMIAELIPELVKTLISMLPQLIDVGIKGILTLIQGITQALPELIKMLPTIIKQIVDTLLDNLPLIIKTGIELIVALINGLAEAIPQLIDYLPEIIETIVEVLIENLPVIVEGAIQIIVALVNGLIQALPKLVTMVPKIIYTIFTTLVKNLPQIVEGGARIISSIVQGIGSMLGSLGTKAGEIVSTIIDKIKSLPSEMVNWGKDMIQGLIDGIKKMIGKVGDAVKGVANKIKNFLHFSRPDEGPLREYEEWMPDMINGLTASLKAASPELINETRNLARGISDAMNIDGSLIGSNDSIASNNQANLVDAFIEALEKVKIDLDDENMGRFVRKEVTNAIFN